MCMKGSITHRIGTIKFFFKKNVGLDDTKDEKRVASTLFNNDLRANFVNTD